VGMVDPEMEEVEMAPGHTGPMVDRMDHALLDILLRLHRTIWAVEMLEITIDIIKVVIDTVVDLGHVVVLAHVPDYHVVNTLLLLTGKETDLETDLETDPEIDLEIEVDTEILVMAHLCHLLKDNIGMVATHHLHMDMVGMDLRMISIVVVSIQFTCIHFKFQKWTPYGIYNHYDLFFLILSMSFLKFLFLHFLKMNMVSRTTLPTLQWRPSTS